MRVNHLPAFAYHCVIVSMSNTIAVRLCTAMEGVLGPGRVTTFKDRPSLEKNVHRSLASPNFNVRQLLILDCQTSSDACSWYIDKLSSVFAKSMSEVICCSDEPAQAQLGRRLNGHIAAILPLPRSQTQADILARYVTTNWSEINLEPASGYQ